MAIAVNEAEALKQLDAALAKADATELRAALGAAIRVVRSETDKALLQSAIARADLRAALRAIPFDRLGVVFGKIYRDSSVLLPAFRAGHVAGVRLIPGGLPVSGEMFEMLRPRAVRYIRNHGLELARELTYQTRQGLKQVFRNTLISPVSRHVTIKQAKEVLGSRQMTDYIGLTERQGKSFSVQLNKWMENPDLSAPKIQQLADRLHNRMVKQRAEMIVQTELSAAGNEGMRQTWRELNKRKDLRIVGIDRKLVGEEINKGGQAVKPAAYRPPLHPRCFCALRLVRIGSVNGEPAYAIQWITRTIGVCPECQAMAMAMSGTETDL